MNGIQKAIKIGAIIFAVLIIVGIFSVIMSGLSFFVDLNISNDKSDNNFDKVYTGISNIEIDTSASNIVFENGSEFRVSARNVTDKFSSKVDGKTLEIDDERNAFPGGNVDSEIIIYIPSDANLNKLEIDSGIGEIKISNVFANKFYVSNGAGTLNIDNSEFLNCDIDGGAGEIIITSSTLNNLDMSSGVGSANIDANILGNSKIDSGVGDINLTLFGSKDDYSINVIKGIGNITIIGEEQKNDTVYGTGINNLKIEGGIGNIDVNFSK